MTEAAVLDEVFQRLGLDSTTTPTCESTEKHKYITLECIGGRSVSVLIFGESEKYVVFVHIYTVLIDTFIPLSIFLI